MALYHQHNVNHSTFGNCEHFAPHGSFMLRAIFFGHSAVRSSITPINQATKYLRRRLSSKSRRCGNVWPANSVGTVPDIGEFPSVDMMGTVLFTDHGILVFAMTTGAIALMHASGVGLSTTHRTRFDTPVAAGWIQRRLNKPPA